VSLDVTHGFYLEGHDIDAEISANQKLFKVRRPSKKEAWAEMDQITLITNTVGKYRYRCSHTCGTMHPFMQGELIVEPNLIYYGGVGGAFGLFLGMLISLFFQSSGRMSRKNQEDVQ
jgi:heme/copper-type cytochrome/quinol oxidase subunit 2